MSWKMATVSWVCAGSFLLNLVWAMAHRKGIKLKSGEKISYYLVTPILAAAAGPFMLVALIIVLNKKDKSETYK